MVEGWRGKLEYWNGGKLVRSQEPVGEWNIGRLGSVSRVAIYCLYPIIPAFQHSSIPHQAMLDATNSSQPTGLPGDDWER